MSFSSLIFMGISGDNSIQDNMFLAVSAPRRLFICCASAHEPRFNLLPNFSLIFFFYVVCFGHFPPQLLALILTLKATVVNVAGHFQYIVCNSPLKPFKLSTSSSLPFFDSRITFGQQCLSSLSQLCIKGFTFSDCFLYFSEQ